MKRIVLLGANGQLGTDILQAFSGSSEVELVPVTRQDLDIEQTERVIPYLQGLGGFQVLINCTAFHNTEQCENDPLKALIVNSLAVIRMAAFCSEHNIVLIHFSTDYVFDGLKEKPYMEEDRTSPLNIYGSTKVAGEKAIITSMQSYFIFRTSSLFGTAGTSGKGGNFVERIYRMASEGKEASIIEDQRMSPTYTRDIAYVVKAFIERDIRDFGIYHCSGEGHCSWYEFAAEIVHLCGLPLRITPIASKEYASACRRPHFSVLDNTKINRITPMPPWQSSLRHYLLEKGYIKNGDMNV
jgi:dTDP-4-dehydrorhamnose reductase